MADIFRIDSAFDRALFDGSSCAFGVFDGVHRGHRFLLDSACASAADSGGRSIALTFDIDPDELFAADKLKKLMTNEDRVAQLAASGVDAVLVLPFTKEFAANEPELFLDRLFRGHAPAHMHVGLDFRFGCKASGTVRDLMEWGSARGMEVHSHELESFDGAPITATRIRGLLAKGCVRDASVLLGRPYSLCGIVEAGRKQGREFGFSTANLRVEEKLRAVGDGVYAAYALVGDTRYKAAVSVGVSPTFAETSSANIEVHVLDFSGDLYGCELEIEFIEWLRPMMTFLSTEELISTVMGNIAWVRENL